MLPSDMRKKGHEAEAQTLASLTKSSVAPVGRTHREVIMIPLENSYEEVLAVSPANHPEVAVVTSSHHEVEAAAGKPPPTEGVLYRPLRPLHCLLTVVGVAPQVYDATTGEFRVSWRRLGSLHVLFTATYLVVITAVTTFSLCRHFVVRSAASAAEDRNVRSVKVIGVAIVGGYQINALVQVLNTVYAGRRHCRLLNSWNRLAKEDGIDPTRGLYLKSCVQVGFIVSFILVMLVLATTGVPAILSHVMDGLAEWMFLVPPSWLTRSTLSAKMVHAAVCLITLHQFTINKGYVFSFTSQCHLLKTGLALWNAQLGRAINEVWQRERRREERLGSLLESRYRLVMMVRDTQEVFSPVLQCYFATAIVIVCTELYLLAKGVGSGTYQMEGMVVLVLLTLQTSCLLFHVSLAAGAVQEQADASGDVLGRGVPYEATDRDKFIVGELTRSLSMSAVYITGGNFFIINRSFILTVVSVIASYFIVILQFMQAYSVPDSDAVSNNITHGEST